MKPEEIQAEKKLPNDQPSLSNAEVFLEMISQRLAQGFQIVLMSEKEMNKREKQKSLILYGAQNLSPKMVIWLSIGGIFHKLTFKGKLISVVIYRPQVSAASLQLQYRYRFQVKTHKNEVNIAIVWVCGSYHIYKIKSVPFRSVKK